MDLKLKQNWLRQGAWWLLPALCALMIAGTAWAEQLAVKVPKANVRSGPGTRYAVVWMAERYTPFTVLKQTNEWYLVEDYFGDQGYIHESLVDTMDVVMTTKSKINIRKGPGKKHPVVFLAGVGVPFRVLSRKGAWLHVEHADGDRGWVHKSLVR